MAADLRVTFHRSSPPYEPGDTAGFPALHARRLVARGVATLVDPEVRPDLAAMSRAELVRYAIEQLGAEGEPPADITDDELRAGLAAQLGGDREAAPDPAAEPTSTEPSPAAPASASGPAK